MSDTTQHHQRSVADIIGFGSWCDGREPNVDAMLAWLRSERVDAFVALVVIDDGEVTVEYVHPEGFNAFAKAPTLQAALEAAVRAVSGLAETPESNPT